MTLHDRITRFNEAVALRGTKAFGTMTTCWIFMTWGLLGMLPFIPPRFTNLVLLISSAWIQLWALPLMATGNVVLNRASEARAAQDHAAIMEELQLVHEAHDAILEDLNQARAERALLMTVHQNVQLLMKIYNIDTHDQDTH